jgi:hypothetical protein
MHYELHGEGGSVWWVDKFGNQPWSAIQQFGFNLFPQSQNPQPILSTLKGSFIVSHPFHVKASQSLTVVATVAAAKFKVNQYQDVGFGVLLQNGKTKYVLFALQPDNGTFYGDGPPLPDFMFAPPDQQAGLTVLNRPFTVTLGGVDYSQSEAVTNLQSVCNPIAGEYRLLLGMFTGLPGPADQPSVTVVWSAEVK